MRRKNAPSSASGTAAASSTAANLSSGAHVCGGFVGVVGLSSGRSVDMPLSVASLRYRYRVGSVTPVSRASIVIGRGLGMSIRATSFFLKVSLYTVTVSPGLLGIVVTGTQTASLIRQLPWHRGEQRVPKPQADKPPMQGLVREPHGLRRGTEATELRVSDERIGDLS